MKLFNVTIASNTTGAYDEIFVQAPDIHNALPFARDIVTPNNARVIEISEIKAPIVLTEHRKRAIKWPPNREVVDV